MLSGLVDAGPLSDTPSNSRQRTGSDRSSATNIYSSDDEVFMDSLFLLFPDADALLKMTPEDLGGVLLRLALPRVQGAGFIPDSVAQVPLHDAADGRNYPNHKRQAVLELVSRTWDMLEREGFIESSRSMNGVYGWRQFSEKGLKIAQGDDRITAYDRYSV